MKLNLYKVTCKGMNYRLAGNTTHGLAYVVAENAEDAYKRVRHHLDSKNIGFTSDRCLDKVELIAENANSPECGIRLFL